MALQNSVEVNGTTYPMAYSRVMHITTFKDEARIFVNTYADQGTRDQEQVDPSIMPIKQQEFVAQAPYEIPAEEPEGVATQGGFDMAGEQFPKAYEFLKLQPEFTGAIDC